MRLLVTASLIAILSISACSASELVVSGDSNIGTGVGNDRFFSNLLGSGTNVVFQTTTSTDTSETASQSAITTYHSSLAGVNVTTVSSFSATTLSGANLFIGFLPDTAYTAGEISAIGGFLNSGGTVLFTGDGELFRDGALADTNIDTALAALGSSLHIVPADDDAGITHSASGSRIATDPLTAGVTSFEYVYTSQVTGGAPVFYDTTGAAFLEEVTAATYGVPEPASLSLLGAGLLAGLFLRPTRSRKDSAV